MNVRSDAVVCEDMSGLEGIASKRLGSRYVSGRPRDWLKMKNPEAPAVKREAEEEWRR
jgi:ATP-dependent DNA ligase